MEQEYFFTGYCRQLDGSRTVCLIEENGRLEEVDCAYPGCPYSPNCGIAEKIRGAIASETE